MYNYTLRHIFLLLIIVVLYMYNRVFLKRHFEKKIKNPTQYAIGVHLGRIYPEGEDDLTSLGGR